MATKADELARPDSTWNKAKPDEPLFILRPKDIFALMLINNWISLAEMVKQMNRMGQAKADVPEAKIQEAIRLRDMVIVYQGTHNDELKIPD